MGVKKGNGQGLEKGGRVKGRKKARLRGKG
jgi:hypothetical protein